VRTSDKWKSELFAWGVLIFAQSALKADLAYPQLIERIIRKGLKKVIKQ
jgi:hypothetical protein